MIFLRLDLVTPAGWRDKLDTWNMNWQTPCHANAFGATACFCHTTRTGATKWIRSANICPGGLFLK